MPIFISFPFRASVDAGDDRAVNHPAALNARG
jgi:hypothetical protein